MFLIEVHARKNKMIFQKAGSICFLFLKRTTGLIKNYVKNVLILY